MNTNTTLLKASLITATLILTGCGTFQESRYESVATAEETRVTASGRAAEVAAASNQHRNCPSCVGSGAQMAPESRPKRNRSRRSIADKGMHTASVQFEVEMNQAIKRFVDFDRWMGR